MVISKMGDSSAHFTTFLEDKREFGNKSRREWPVGIKHKYCNDWNKWRIRLGHVSAVRFTRTVELKFAGQSLLEALLDKVRKGQNAQDRNGDLDHGRLAPSYFH